MQLHRFAQSMSPGGPTGQETVCDGKLNRSFAATNGISTTNLRALICAVAIAFLPMHQAEAGETVTPELASDQVQELIAFVQQAADLVAEKGPEAFGQLRDKNGPWFGRDRYIVVNDLVGNVLVDPNRPEFEGTNQIRLRDADGKGIVKQIIQEVAGESRTGWVHYLWPKYALSEPYWKSTYAVRVADPSGKDYIVSSGLFGVKNQGLFVVDTVDEAAELVRQRGRDAFDAFRDPAGPFLYDNTYVFVFDERGTELVNAGFPGFEGRNLLGIQDSTGAHPVRTMIDALENQDTAWVEYNWPKPNSASSYKKMAYVKRVETGGETLYVGSGLYLD